jgi:hypothetical protein
VPFPDADRTTDPTTGLQNGFKDISPPSEPGYTFQGDFHTHPFDGPPSFDSHTGGYIQGVSAPSGADVSHIGNRRR